LSAGSTLTAPATQRDNAAAATPSVTPPRSRNDPCWCGSGKRFKGCHGALGNVGTPNAPNVSAIAGRLAQEALAAQLADNLALAESRYRECLALDPQHADALHMLGVVRLAAFDFAEARKLIEKAGALTQWQQPSYRHNYGYLLSAYLPANSVRVSPAQREALASLRASRCVAAPTDDAVTRCAVLMHARATVHADENRVPVPDVSAEASVKVSMQVLHLPVDTALNSCAQIRALLAEVDADYVSFASADMPPDGKRVADVISLLESQNAGWGFSTPAFASETHDEMMRWPGPLNAAAAGLSNAQFAERTSAMCVAAPLLPLSINNLVIRTALLRQISWQSHAVRHALGEMVLALCQLDEPVVCAGSPFAISAAAARMIAEDFELTSQLTDAAQRAYLAQALGHAPFVNPLAPNLVTKGLSFLKRPLRYGAGAALDAAGLRDIAARIDSAVARAAPLRNDGFELVGFARAESGLGENMRALSRACTAVTLPHSVIDIDIETGIRKSDDALDGLIAAAPSFRRQIICVNPDALSEAIHHEGAAAITSAYKIGYWFWELEKLPAAWIRASSTLQELWTSSEFVRRAVERSVSIPVYKVPTPIRPPVPSRPYARHEFGLDDSEFVFLFSFAYGSMIARKNPWAVVRAFREAFPAGVPAFAQVKLVVKSVQSELFAHEAEALRAMAANDPRIVFMDRVLSRDQVMGLQSVIDCYVSLHRSEGFGLGMAECMAIGKPVIGTAYSANLDFMNESNSLLVDYSLIAVKPGEYPDTQDQVWADADVDAAARQMRLAYENPTRRHELGHAARAFMHEHYSPVAVGALLRSHLARLNETDR
jgi:glycosyltransferase involved in cell wall biosynthesis